jgi:hypothetical protein
MPCPHCPHCRAASAAAISSTIAAFQIIRDTLATGEPCAHPADWVTSTPSGQGGSTEICACGAVGHDGQTPPPKPGPHDLRPVDAVIANLKRRLA